MNRFGTDLIDELNLSWQKRQQNEETLRISGPFVYANQSVTVISETCFDDCDKLFSDFLLNAQKYGMLYCIDAEGRNLMSSQYLLLSRDSVLAPLFQWLLQWTQSHFQIQEESEQELQSNKAQQPGILDDSFFGNMDLGFDSSSMSRYVDDMFEGKLKSVVKGFVAEEDNFASAKNQSKSYIGLDPYLAPHLQFRYLLSQVFPELANLNSAINTCPFLRPPPPTCRSCRGQCRCFRMKQHCKDVALSILQTFLPNVPSWSLKDLEGKQNK